MRCCWARGTLVVFGVFLATANGNPGIALGQIQAPAFGRVATGQHDPLAGVYLPTERTLSRAVTRAKERLDQHEYHEALQFLHGILGREEDWFFDGAAAATEQRGVKATTRQLIGQLPPEGHDAYERLHGTAARRQLEAALQSGSRADLSKVVRQFFHTAAGYEATLVLAQAEADQGHYLAAAQLYRELIDSPRASASFEPQLSVMAAVNYLAAGERDAAADTMRSLIERSPSTEVKLAGQTVQLPAVDADFVAWLIQYVGEPPDASLGDVNWLTARGGPARNVQKGGGRPHLRPRWQARVVNDPTTEAYLAGRNEDFLQRGVVVLPGARPIAVGDVIVMRTPENVVAVDFQTGKRIWETREDDELQDDQAPSEFPGRLEREQWAVGGNPLDERVWDDALVSSLSSDGKHVFVLRGVAVAEDEQMMGWRMAPGFGFGRGDGETRATTNQLAAYDMASQGKLAWELDGSRAPSPLDGAFFLGAPLAIDNTLYVMAEVRSAIYLFALDPATGHVLWQQQLLGLEQSIGMDAVRRRAGATPSYDAGILVCPTSASTVIGIDVVKREFAWVYRYPREPVSPAEMRAIWQNQLQAATSRSNDRWLDSVAVIGEGRVFLTPPESAELHCIDLRTGKQVWTRRQGESLFVACVDQGNVLLVGAGGVQALRAADASPAWRQETVVLPSGALPAGQGYLSDGCYYLPLTTGEIAAIATSDGKLTIHPAPRPGAELGNLICHRGSILSQSALLLDKFEQLDVLQQRVDKALAENSDDATALRELAELKRNDDTPAECVSLLKRAFALAPDDALTQEMLAEVLLEALAKDYAAYRDDVPTVSGLIHDRGQQIELLRIEASGLDDLGQRLPALDAYLRLADFTAEAPALLRISPVHTVRSDRWVCGRLGLLWSKAAEEERARILSRLTALRPSLDKPRTAAELRHYLAHVDELPGADEARSALARFMIERKRPQEAEIELLALAARRADSTAIAQLTSRLTADSAVKGPRVKTITDWPRGRVNAEFIAGIAANADARGANRNQPERQSGYRQLRIEQDSSLTPAAVDWFIALDCSELVGRNGLGDDVFHLAIDQSRWARAFRDGNLAHAARLGRLLYVMLGGQVLAIDSASAAVGNRGDVLWQTDPFGRYAGDQLVYMRTVGEATPRANRRPAYHYWSGRRRMTSGASSAVLSLGPVTPRGVVFQEHDQLKCVEPMSGELLWARSDIPAGCELLGDTQYVFAADIGSRVAHVIRMVDGQLVGKRDLPKHEWLLTAGRNIAEVGSQVSRESKSLSIRVSDLLNGEELYNHEFPNASRVSVMEPNGIAIYEPTGKFRVIDVRTGAVTMEHDLEPLADVDSISTLKSGDNLFLMISRQPDQQHKPLAQQPDFPMVDGFVYAFDQTTGKPLWPAPAIVRNRGIVLSQPREIPLLVFADRKMVRDPATGGGWQLRVLCIDQRTGQTVYRNDKLPDTSIVNFRIRGEPGASSGGSAVAVELNAGKIQLAMTDRPRPPRPPVNDDLETLRDDGERGLRGIGKRMSGALQGALENPAERERLRQMQLIEQARRQALQAQQEALRRLQLERAKRQADQNVEQELPQTDDD